jgi:CzcA family heavy metal efflux pump
MIEFVVRNRPVVLLAVICIFLFGGLTYRSLPRESFPDIDVPVVMVTTPYIGVSPEDIEALITIPLENELAGLKDLDQMTSTSAEGASIIALEFQPEVVIEDALQRVRDRVNRVTPELPDDAEDTEIREVSFADFPIMIITIAGAVDEEQLKTLGEKLEEDLDRVNGVLESNLSGGRTREIQVQVDPFRLQHYSLGMNDVVGAVAEANVNIPGGDVGAGDARFLVRVPGEFEDPRELEGVPVKRVGDVPVFVRDVASVMDTFADRDSYARMNGDPAVTIAVTKRTGANILEVAEEVKAVLARHAAAWPDAVRWRVVGDQSRDIADMVNELENNVITALILVVAVIVFFMGARNSLFVAMSIPLSMLLGMIIVWSFGMTLNMIVLFSLILGLGMLVDNAIVLVENIYRHAEEGKSLAEASIAGTKEIAPAVAASTATTVAAFVPLLFWTGIMGQFMGYLPKTVVIVLLCSLVVAVLILPVLTTRYMKRGKKTKEEFRDNAMMRGYRRVLLWSIRHRYVALGLGFASLVGTFVAFGFLNHGTEFFPEIEPDRATVSIRAPDGTDLEATDRIVRRVEAIVAAEENVDFYVAETGIAGGGDPLAGAQAAANQARITIDFLPHETKAHEGQTVRVEDTRRTIERIRAQLVEIPGAEIEIEKQREGPPVGAPIAVEVQGEDFDEVGAVAGRVRRELEAIAGTTNLSDNYRVGRPEMRLRVNRAAAERVGASTQDVAGAIRTAIAGTEATKFRDGEDEYDVVVKLAPQYKDDLEAVMGLRIPGREDTSPDTFWVPLSAVASYDLAGGTGSIRHIDQDLVATIEGDVEEGFNENAVRAAVIEHIEKAEVPEGMHLRLGGADDEQRKAQEFLSNAFLVALFLVALVLVAQFNRFDVPFIIMTSVLLSLVGVLWGLILTGTPFGIIMTGIGIISLAGVVVNNGIVLLDYVQQLRWEEGWDPYDALVEAGMTRFRPVVLTALTTILGLVPMAVGINFDFTELELVVGSQSAQWWGPMAVAVIFGLGFATVLTLVLVPTMYSILLDIRALLARIARLFKRDKPATAPAE